MNQLNRDSDVENLRDKFAHLPYASPQVPRDALVRRPALDYEGAALARSRNGRGPTFGPWMFVLATTLNTTVATVISVVVTITLMNREQQRFMEMPTAAMMPRQSVGFGLEPASASAVPQYIYLRPIGSPDRPLQLQPQRPALLPLQITPEEGANEPYIITLTGAPQGTMLFGPNRISTDAWFLPPGGASRVEIALPEWSAQVFEITIGLRRPNGLVAAQTKAYVSVSPPVATAFPPADEATARNLMARADQLITSRGDIVGARAMYQRAADLGSASAALALGATYDPNRLWSLGVLGLAGNKERAKQWYQRASDLGNSEAKARLTALGF
jgi:hypothetical protein